MKRLISLVAFFGIALTLSFLLTTRFFAVKQQRIKTSSNKVQVVASFYPLYYFAQQIGGVYANVTNLTPAGSEPHDYDPSPQQIAKLEQSQILILNGGGLEAWSDKVTKNLEGKPVLIITVGTNFIGGSADKTIIDPHVWLDPVLAKREVAQIVAGFESVDPAHARAFQTNAQALQEKLDSLDAKYRQTLTRCDQKNIVTSHAAFGHLAQEYGLNQIAISGLSPDEEPSPSKLAEVATFARQLHIRYIFFESLVSPKLSETIAKEVGAQPLVLDPLEGLSENDIQSGKNYFSVMEDNLSALRMALECKQ